jgi:hypothetical protein
MTPVASSVSRCSSSRIIDQAAQVLATVNAWSQKLLPEPRKYQRRVELLGE